MTLTKIGSSQDVNKKCVRVLYEMRDGVHIKVYEKLAKGTKDNVSNVTETTTGVIEHVDCFEYKGIFMSKENFGKPICPDIELNPIEINSEKSQAWGYLIDENSKSNKYSGFELWKQIFPWLENMSEKEAKEQKLYPALIWKYNNLAAIKEGEFRKVKIPSNKELIAMRCSIYGNNIALAMALRIPFDGGFLSSNDEFLELGDGTRLWSSSTSNDPSFNEANSFHLHRNGSGISWIDRNQRLSVRSFWINERK